MNKFGLGDVVVRHPEYNKNSGSNLPSVVLWTLDERFIECIEFRFGSIYISVHPTEQYRKIGEIQGKSELAAFISKLKEVKDIKKMCGRLNNPEAEKLFGKGQKSIMQKIPRHEQDLP